MMDMQVILISWSIHHLTSDTFGHEKLRASRENRVNIAIFNTVAKFKCFN